MGRRSRARSSRVYFIKCEAGPIKIGVASDVAKRRRALQCASPTELRVVAHVAGGRALERHLHGRLAAHRIRGEWFADTLEVHKAMAELVAREPPPGARASTCEAPAGHWMDVTWRALRP